MKRRFPKVTVIEFAIAATLLAIIALISIPAFVRAREASRRASCQNNLKQMGIVFKMYAGDHKDFYPPRSPIPGNWIFDINAVYPNYLTDLSVLVCPDSPFAVLEPFQLRSNALHAGFDVGELHPDCVSSLFYNYTGFAAMTDETAYALFRAERAAPGIIFARDEVTAQVPQYARRPNVGGGQSAIPILWDRVFVDETAFSHTRPLGGNVLHMDGHVEFVRYSYYNNTAYFPITGLSAETFGADVPVLSSDCYAF